MSNPAVRSEVTTRHNGSDSTRRNYKDGEFLKKHPVFKNHPNALQIVVYYDDIEVAIHLDQEQVFIN